MQISIGKNTLFHRSDTICIFFWSSQQICSTLPSMQYFPSFSYPGSLAGLKIIGVKDSQRFFSTATQSKLDRFFTSSKKYHLSYSSMFIEPIRNLGVAGITDSHLADLLPRHYFNHLKTKEKTYFSFLKKMELLKVLLAEWKHSDDQILVSNSTLNSFSSFLRFEHLSLPDSHELPSFPPSPSPIFDRKCLHSLLGTWKEYAISDVFQYFYLWPLNHATFNQFGRWILTLKFTPKTHFQYSITKYSYLSQFFIKNSSIRW